MLKNAKIEISVKIFVFIIIRLIKVFLFMRQNYFSHFNSSLRVPYFYLNFVVKLKIWMPTSIC